MDLEYRDSSGSSTEAADPPAFNPLQPVPPGQADPLLVKLRRRCPVSEPVPGHFFVATDAEARQVLLDWSGFSNAGNFQLDEEGVPADPPTIAQLDPPRHNLFRKLVSTGLSPRAVREAEPFVRQTALQLVEGVRARGEGELMSFLAQPLPALTIAHMIGVPPERAPDFSRWTAAITSTVPRPFHHLGEWGEFTSFVDSLIAERRRSDDPPDDIVTRLVRAEEEGAHLDDGEIRMAVFQFIVAGNDTATRLIGNVVYQLLRTPALWERLLGERDLVPAAVEESLRYDAPIQWVMRRCTRDTSVGDVSIRQGDRVLVGIGSANRDDRVWPESSRFLLDRAAGTDKHLALGFGRHFCLGAPLGRLEAVAALETLLDRLPSLRLAPGFEMEYVESAMMRGPRRLDVRWEPAQASA